MKIAVIGAGISGLSVARLLRQRHEVVVYERQSCIGGIAHVRMVDGIPYHTVGGHCLNSKNRRVMDFVHEALPEHNWHKIQRAAKILFKGALIDYPIEFSLKQIAKLDGDLAYRMLKDLLSAEAASQPENLEQWFIGTFGRTLADEYFIPYNSKIWGEHPSRMSASWVQGKLPIPDKKSVFMSLLQDVADDMPHSYFYYPNANTQNALTEALAAGLDVRQGHGVERLEKNGAQWQIDGGESHDMVISTIPLNRITNLLQGVPQEVSQAAGLLKYNKISNMLWETDEVDATWIYFPDPEIMFHRQIQIGKFISPQKNYAITEVVGEVSAEDMERAGKRIPHLKKALDHHISDHAYVVYDQNNNASKNTVKQYLDSIGIHTLGRFGEWEYYNMDVCMERAMNLAASIQD